MAHTPGPWLVSSKVGQRNPLYRGIVTLLTRDPYLAVVVEDDERAYHTIDPETLAANAALIAAAPDLLEALEKLLWSVEHYTNMPYANREEYEFDQEEIQQARAALRKAKGE